MQISRACGRVFSISCKCASRAPFLRVKAEDHAALEKRYYQVVMMIDIFQYSNMYTCKPAIQRKIKDKSVSEECGAYVTHAGELQNLLESAGDFTS